MFCENKCTRIHIYDLGWALNKDDISNFAVADGLYQGICCLGATREEKHQPLVVWRGDGVL